MHALTWLAQNATPSPTMTVDPDDVTPGFLGFAAIALLSVAVVLLLVDMLRRIRRARYRLEVTEELDREVAVGQTEAENPDAADEPPRSSDARRENPAKE